jgi:hypothetical protein
VVDFDGGLIGSALTTSIQSIAARPGVPTFTFLSAQETSLDQVQDKVWNGDVWAAVWANAGQTEVSPFWQSLLLLISPHSSTIRSNQALNSYLTTNATFTSTATPSYDPSAAYTYTGLQTRYFTVWSSYVLPVLLEATGTAGGIVNTALQSVYPDRSGFDDARRSILANPTGATFDNVSPMPFTVRVLVSCPVCKFGGKCGIRLIGVESCFSCLLHSPGQLNTVGVVIIILFQFFVSLLSRLSLMKVCAYLLPLPVPHGSERDLYRDGALPKHLDKDALDAQIPYQDRLDLVDELERCGSLSGV